MVVFVVAVAIDRPALFSPATLLFTLGWALPYASIGKHSKKAINLPLALLPLLLIFGLFYYMASHSDHIDSGLGFGLDHLTHNLMGFGILVVTEGLTVLTAWTRAKQPT